MVAGKITDYSFSIDADGTYPVMLEISQGNQMSLAIPINIGNTQSAIAANAKPAIAEFIQWKNLLEADLNLENLNITEAAWKKEFFNWGKVNESKKDETASLDSYLSLRFVLKVLMNYTLSKSNGFDDSFLLNVPKYKVDGKDEEIIPIRIHKNLISSSDDVIYPNDKLVKFVAPIKGSKEANVVLVSDKPQTCTINGYSIVESKKVSMTSADGTGELVINPLLPGSDYRNGNALNTFIKYKTVVQIWRASYTRIDFLDGILKLINSNSYGLFRLIRGNVMETTSASVLDLKSINDAKADSKQDDSKIYRFKPCTPNSIVKEFTFNFEMSNLVAGRTVFNSQRFLVEALKKVKDPKDTTKIALQEDDYKQFDNSLFSNSDGYYSINKIDLKALEKNFEDAVKRKTIPKEDKPEENKAKDITELIESKSVKFKFDKTTTKTLIYKDAETIKKVLSDSTNKIDVSDEKSTLTPIDITITIDGMSGFSCGEYFRINGVPEIYNEIGVFQITNVKHAVSNDGWQTTLEAGFRIIK
jgi:hypothetical protein